jgi:hypothetical protein
MYAKYYAAESMRIKTFWFYENVRTFARFEVYTAVRIQIRAFWGRDAV